MRVNGNQIALWEKVSLREFLRNEGYDPSKVAVERNGNIVRVKSFETEMLTDGDSLEIVRFVGGG